MDFEARYRRQVDDLLASEGLPDLESLVLMLISPSVDPKPNIDVPLRKEIFVNSLCIALARLLHAFIDVRNCSNSAHLLHLILPRQGYNMWPHLHRGVQENLKDILLACSSRPVHRKYSRILAELSSDIYAVDEEWPQFITFLSNYLDSDSPMLALQVISCFPEHGQLLFLDVLKPHIESLNRAVANTLQSGHGDVCVTSFGAIISLAELFTFRIFEGMMHKLTEMLRNYGEMYARDCLEHLMGLARKPTILRAHLNTVFRCIIIVLQDAEEVATLMCCMECLFTIGEVVKGHAPRMMMNLDQDSIRRLFMTSMEAISIYAHMVDTQIWGGDINFVGADWFSRVLMSFGGRSILHIAFGVLDDYFGPGDSWKHYAGIIALVELAQSCSKIIINHLDEVLRRPLVALGHPCRHVREVALYAVVELSTYLSPEIDEYCHKILLALFRAHARETNERVKGKAIATIMTFGYKCEMFFLSPYIGILSKLDHLLGLPEMCIVSFPFFNIIKKIVLNQEYAVKCCKFLPRIIEACHSENPDMQQETVFGIGIFSEFGGYGFKTHARDAVAGLLAVLNHHPRVVAYNSAILSLGKLCEFHSDSIDVDQVIDYWLNLLPVRNDHEEAKAVHKQLCSLVEKQEQTLLGLNNQNLPRILAIFNEVLAAGTDLATEQTCTRMTVLLERYA